MPRHRLEQVTSVLRDRTRDAIEMGALRAGDKLPGSRRLAAELEADPRVIAAAFRRLEQEGLVELRPRSGVYVASEIDPSRTSNPVPMQWAIEFVSQAVERGIAADRIGAALGALTSSHKVRAAVVAMTSDQAVGIVRELQDDYGMAAAALFPEQLRREEYPASLTRSHLIVTTADYGPGVRAIAETLKKSLIVVRVRPDLFSGDWVAFMNGPVYVVVSDPRFRAMLEGVLGPVPGSANVTVLLAGSDDLAVVPRDARTYVTESARRMLGRSGLPGRVIRPRRVFSSETVREVIAFLVAHNAARQAR